MADGRRTFFLASAIFFVLVFGALTVAALSSATLNVATLVIAAASVFVIVAVLLALVEAIRHPPE
jgi:hypothetical protein